MGKKSSSVRKLSFLLVVLQPLSKERRAENLARTNSYVLMGLFFGIGSVILKMKTDSLRNFHNTPPDGYEN
jgi:hypothetical protein